MNLRLYLFLFLFCFGSLFSSCGTRIGNPEESKPIDSGKKTQSEEDKKTDDNSQKILADKSDQHETKNDSHQEIHEHFKGYQSIEPVLISMEDQSTPRKVNTPAVQESDQKIHQNSSSKSSLVSFALTDAPGDPEIKQFWIKIDSLFLKSQKGWYRIKITHQDEIDVLALQNGKTLNLVDISAASLPNSISEYRILLAHDHVARIVTVDNRILNVKTPSATSSGLKVKGSTNLIDKEASKIIFDFDVRRSIDFKNKNKAMLSPVIHVIDNSEELIEVSGVVKDSNIDKVCLYEGTIESTAIESTCASAIRTSKVESLKYGFYFLWKQPFKLAYFKGSELFLVEERE